MAIKAGTEKSRTFIDKSKWPVRGQWDSEPDKVQWIDEATGLPCLAVRAHAHWCGYVGVAEGHPAFQVGYNDVRPSDGEWIDVHGGLTFAGLCQENEDGVCHVPEPGQPHKVWWLGFDCAHSGDYRPPTLQGIFDIEEKYGGRRHEQYRTLGYVQTECAELARQLAAL